MRQLHFQAPKVENVSLKRALAIIPVTRPESSLTGDVSGGCRILLG